MEDWEILDLFQQRSEQAILEVSRKYGPLCMKLAYNILGNISDAEECVNDAYLALWNRIPPEEPNPISAYLCTIVRNISINRYYSNTAHKRNSQYTIALQELDGCIPSPVSTEDILQAKQITHSIESFLKKLDKRSRVLFIRRYWHGDSIEELSAFFGISCRAVSVRLFRIREKLRKYLRKEGMQI